MFSFWIRWNTRNNSMYVGGGYIANPTTHLFLGYTFDQMFNLMEQKHLDPWEM